jgi:hypothetical protein
MSQIFHLFYRTFLHRAQKTTKKANLVNSVFPLNADFQSQRLEASAKKAFSHSIVIKREHTRTALERFP